MAYFDLKKNEKNNNYLERALNCYNQALEYLYTSRLCWKVFKHRGKEVIIMNSSIVNMAFSCELFLKSILYFKDIQIKNKHDLYSLFLKLPVEIQNNLKKNINIANNDELEKILKDLGNAFVVFRYSYEYKSLCINLEFLGKFMINLEQECYMVLNEVNT